MNKYRKWYNELIITRKMMKRNLEFSERHHIIPKSLGGTDEPSNLVVLTPREHFIAHYLLFKAEPCVSTASAVHFMLRVNGRGNRYLPKSSILYETAKNAKYKFMRGKVLPKNKVCPHCQQAFTASAFKQFHGEMCLKHPDVTIAAQNKIARSRPLKRGQIARPIINVQCPWCNKTGDKGAMKIWHFDKCLQNPQIDLISERNSRAKRLKPSHDKMRTVNMSASQKEKCHKCPWCGKIGTGAAMFTWHFDNCTSHPDGPSNRPVKTKLSNDHKNRIKAGLSTSLKKIGRPKSTNLS